MVYLAHITDDGRQQTVTEHLTRTAERCSQFASEFGCGDHGYFIGMAHDIGKCSEAFQRRLHGGPKVDHATAGAIECVKLDCDLDACAVVGHHSGLPDYGNLKTDQQGDPTFCGRIRHGIANGIPPYTFEGKLNMPKSPMPHWDNDLSLSFWVRMLYSCLVDADFLDTEEFMLGSHNLRPNYDSMEQLLERLNTYINPWWNPSTELNQFRCQILRACLDSGVKAKGLYTLTVPTGGGKTIASLAFALKHALAHSMKHIIYIVPYTSIIEQNATVFQKILGAKNVIEHHSNVVIDLDQESSENIAKKRRATENWDAPVIVTTAVQFFESIYANRSSKCRKLHNLANSVLIFDEAQMIPTVHLKPCVAAIGNLVEHFGATAVLCTATQPVLNDLFHEFASRLSIQELCPGTSKLYDHFRRVTFRQLRKLSNNELASQLKEKNQVLCIVNSRKAAQEIYDLLPKEGTYHLSTLMFPAHRQAVLSEIRNRLKTGAVCRVISTSLIEAGVDVDFPAVYREKAGLDSIQQAAGRCNREGKYLPDKSIVSIFEGECTPPPLFRINIGACTEALAGNADPGNPETVHKYFTSLRSLIGDSTDKAHIISAMKNGISGCRLPFKTVAERFHLIDETTLTVYIPLEGGTEFIERILSGTATRIDYRVAGRYAVSIYRNHYKALMASGCLRAVDDESAVLTNLQLYSAEKGLSLSADSGQALFI